MPTYDYACDGCGGFEAFRPLAARNEPAPCPHCRQMSGRVLSGAASLALMDGNTRRAIETNELARNVPKRSSELAKKAHPAGCGCCSSSKRGATVTSPSGNKAFPSKRPWMISH